MQTLSKSNEMHYTQLPARTKVYRKPTISPGVVSPLNGRLCLTSGIDPRHPYAGNAMSSDDVCEIARESAASTSSSPLRKGEMPRRGTALDESASSSDGRTCANEDMPSRFIRVCITSGEAPASAGRYTFMATTDAPKSTLAQMANRATKIHSYDE